MCCYCYEDEQCDIHVDNVDHVDQNNKEEEGEGGGGLNMIHYEHNVVSSHIVLKYMHSLMIFDGEIDGLKKELSALESCRIHRSGTESHSADTGPP